MPAGGSDHEPQRDASARCAVARLLAAAASARRHGCRCAGAGAAGPVALAGARRSSTAGPCRMAARSWRSTPRTARRMRRWCRSACAACCRPATPRRIRGITLVIDENPSPLAAVFTPGADSGMRVAVHPGPGRFLHQRPRRGRTERRPALCDAALRQGGGRLLGAGREAGGGHDPARRRCGSVSSRLRPTPIRQREAQLMIRHPNYSGMQMDQVTRLYVPAHFVKSVRIWQGEELLLVDRERHLDLREPGLPLRLPPQWRDHLQRRDGGQRGQVVPPGMARDARPDRRRLEAAHLGLGLCLLEFTHHLVGGRAAELLTEIAARGRRMRSTVSAFSYLS